MLWRKIITYWHTIGIGSVILYLSLLRTPHLHFPLFAGADKVAHLCMYTLLGIAMLYDLNRDRQPLWRCIAVTLIAGSIYGGVIELMQEYLFPPRTGDWLDLLADFAGLTLSLTALWLIPRSSTH